MPVWELENSIHIGEIHKPHSYLGSVKVAFFMGGLVEVLIPDSFLFIEITGKPVPYKIESIQWTADDAALVKLKGIDSEETASELKGKKLTYSANALDDLEEEDDDMLLVAGFEVIDETLGSLGKIIDVMDTAGQQILVIKNGEKEILVPFHEDFITDINPKKKTMKMNLPDGLTDLNP
ncbi:MAG: ribosome maturation factor RimM [Bacteroidetes bacterium]|nr:ribosome maturation factor RimM [Bacteroidota bacterium]